MKKAVWFLLGCLIVFVTPILGRCPPADLTGDCYVNLEDVAELAAQWLTGSGIPDGMVYIPGGTFQMGDSFNEGLPDEIPVHTVTLSPFYMDRYEVTNEQYCKFLQSALIQGTIYISSENRICGTGNNQPYCDTSESRAGSSIYFGFDGRIMKFITLPKSGRSMANDPVVWVSWYGAAAYCNWQSQQEGRQLCYNLSTWVCDFSKDGYRLPTEAEWEYAAKGGQEVIRFPWGYTISHSQANYYSHSQFSYDVSTTRGFHPAWNDGIQPYTSPIGSFPASGYGLYDMAGNVSEWCNDWYSSDYYSSSQQISPTGPTTGDFRVLCGGSWGNYANLCRVSSRVSNYPYSRSDHYGFRLVLDH